MCRVFCLYVCACVSSAQKGQKRALLPLELEVQVVFEPLRAAGTRIWDHWKSSQCSQLLLHLFSPYFMF